MTKYTLSTILSLFAVCTISANTWYPDKDWVETPNPYASPYAVPGGTLRYAGYNPPKTINYYLGADSLSAQFFALMYEPLLAIDSETNEFIPSIAKRWSISEDKNSFTFVVDERAQWSDNTPVTAHDIKATFDALRAPMNITGSFKVVLTPFKEAEVIDDMTIRFTTDEVHWRSLLSLANIYVMPKKMIDGVDFNKINFDFPIVSGPYYLKELEKGLSLTMRRRPDYWGFLTQSNKGLYNFDEIYLRFYMESNNAYEAFIKEEMDFYAVYGSRIWNLESVGDKFDKNWILKQNIYNHKPMGFQGYVMNMRKPPYNDINVRKALYHLWDNDRMIRTLMYNSYPIQRSYYGDLYNQEYPRTTPTYSFSLEKAHEHFILAGYKINTKTGRLEKNGIPLIVRILTRDASSNVFLALYKNALQQLGITLEIDQKDLASWMREMDSFNFEMTIGAWGGTVFRDPEPMWASWTADAKGGSNYAGISDPTIDALIKEQRTEFSIARRNEILREIDAYLCEYSPYILNWGGSNSRLLYWNKFGMPKCILPKFGDDRSPITYWWYDVNNAQELKNAMENDLPLPSRPEEVYFDELIKE